MLPIPFSQICVFVLKTSDNSAKILIDLGVLEIDESFIVYMQQLQRTLFLDISRDVYWLVHTLYTKLWKFT